MSLNGIRIGAQLVSSAWLAVKFTGDGYAVGTLFVSSAMSAIVFAKPIGKLTSLSESKRLLLIVGHGSMAVAAMIPFVLSHSAGADRFPILVVVCSLTTTLNQISAGGTDYLVKSLNVTGSIQREVAILMSSSQISMMIGTAGAGTLLLFADFAYLFSGLAGLSLICCLLTIWRIKDAEYQRHLPESRPSSSPPLFPPQATNRAGLLKFTIASMALAFAVGQITNVLLPGLVQLQRNGSSVDYAAVEIAWSVGSVIAGGALAIYRRATFDARASDSVVVAVLAALTVLLMTVPFAPNWPALIAVHLLLGIGYATVRVINDARFLTLCAEEHLGHTRATANIMMQIAALAAFSLPIVANRLSLPALYLCAAGAIGIATAVIGWCTLRLDKSTE